MGAVKRMHSPSILSVLLMALAVLYLLGPAPAASATPTDDTPTRSDLLILFHGDGCPHCAAEREFLVGLADRHPDLEIRQYEVWNDTENQDLLKKYATALNFEPTGVPVTIVDKTVWIGFSDSVAQEVEAAVEAGGNDEPPQPTSPTQTVDVPLLGSMALDSSSLVFATLVIGFVDGINPCSLWVLSVLLAIVLHGGSRGRVALVGSTFLVVTAAMYGLYIVGFYNALDYVSGLDWIALAVAAVAMTFGVLQIKDGLSPGKGPSLSISTSRRPGLFRRMRSVAAPDRGLLPVLGGTVVLAVGVSLLETPCTAGLPLLWSNLLAQQGVSTATAVALFALYMAVFLLDELILFGAAVFTLRATKIQENHGRLLKLIAGGVMVTLATTMVIAPQALTTLAGTVLVFTVSGLLVAVLWLIARRSPSVSR